MELCERKFTSEFLSQLCEMSDDHLSYTEFSDLK